MWKAWTRRARAAVMRSSGPVNVERAALLDGSRLWVTLDAPADGCLVAQAQQSEEVTGLEGRVDAGRHTIVVNPAELTGVDEEDYWLYFEAGGERHPLRMAAAERATASPYVEGSPWSYQVAHGEATIILRRRATPPFRAVNSLEVSEHGIEITWEAQDGDEIALIADGADWPIPTESLGTGRVRLSAIALGTSRIRGSVCVRNRDQTVPLGRARNDLARPNAAVVLPEIETETGTLRLAWSATGSLCVIWRPR